MPESVNIGSAVIKRENRPAEEVINLLSSRGWEVTGQIRNRVTYMENSGINISIIDGPAATLIIPSGPIRGMIFGSERFLSRTSVIGAGKRNDDSGERPRRNSTDRGRTLN